MAAHVGFPRACRVGVDSDRRVSDGENRQAAVGTYRSCEQRVTRRPSFRQLAGSGFSDLQSMKSSACPKGNVRQLTSVLVTEAPRILSSRPYRSPMLP